MNVYYVKILQYTIYYRILCQNIQELLNTEKEEIS